MKHRNVHLTLLNSAHFYWIFKPDLVTAIFILINKCYCSWDIGWDCTFCCTSDSLSCAQTISFPFWIFKFLRHTTLNSKKLQRKKVTFAFHNNIHILKFASSSLSSLPSSPLPLSNVLLMHVLSEEGNKRVNLKHPVTCWPFYVVTDDLAFNSAEGGY